MRKKNKKCNTGGPLTPPPDSTAYTVLPYQILPSSPKTPVKGSIKYGNTSSKSKSKDRLREKKNGGFLDLLGNISPILGAVTTGVNLVSSVASALNKDKQVISASPGYQDGGKLKSTPQNDPERIKSIQRTLRAAGYYKGEIDGIEGPLTKAAKEKYLAESGINLPAYEVISSNDPEKRKTLKHLKKAEETIPGAYRVWEMSNKPNIVLNDSYETVPHYNPLSNEISLTPLYDAKYFLDNMKGEDRTRYQNYVNKVRNDVGSITDEETKWARSIEDRVIASSAKPAYGQYGTLIPEMTHSYQRRTGRLPLTRAAYDWGNSPYLTRAQQQKQYEIPGSLEHEAHQVIEPKLNRIAKTSKRNYSIDPGEDAPSTAKFNTGGDLQLTNNSFQVKDNPNVTDGKFYPEYAAYLDHNEVVKNDFVFSDTLRSPISGEKFSKEALRLEKSTKRAQRRLKADPTDPHAKATISHNEKASAELAAMQEHIAAKMGLRNSPTHLQYGGPTDPMNPANYQWLDPLSIYTLRPSDRFPSMHTQSATPNPSGRHVSGPWDNWVQQSIRPAAPPVASPATTAPKVSKHTPQRKVTPNTTVTSPVTPAPAVDPRIQFFPKPGQDTPPPFGEQPVDLLPTPELGPQTFTQNSVTDSQLANATTTANPRQRNKFTTGDYIQLGALAGEFLPLLGGAEKDKAQMDSTPITKESYDVQQVLAQNQRNFANVAATINTPSETLRRAILSQLDATKANRDNQALTQYQQMNETARVRYEDRLSNQRRFNIGQKTYTDNINAANRAAYRSSVQNAFTSLNNLGLALNDREMQQKQLALLQTRYKDVYDNIISSLMNNG